MKKSRIALALIILGAFGISALSLLLPKPADAEIRQYYSPLATSVVLIDVILAVGAAILFLMALKNFQKELKPAYRLMAFSALAVGIGLLIFPYIEYYGRWDIIWFNVGSYAQYLVGAPLMYFGLRAFYKRVGLSGWASKAWLVALAIAVLSFVHALLPHFDVWPDFSELGYDFFQIVTIIPLVAYLVATYMAFRIRRHIGQAYQLAFGWLAFGLALYVFNTGGIVVLETVGYENWYFENRVYTAPAILGDFGLVMAGYYFAVVGLPRQAGFISRLFSGAGGQDVSSADLIIYASSLSSDREKIDSYLDGMRALTAQHASGQPFSVSEQKTLMGVYLSVERQLLTDDKLRSFTKEGLRSDISKRFSLDKQADRTFWPMLEG